MMVRVLAVIAALGFGVAAQAQSDAYITFYSCKGGKLVASPGKLTMSEIIILFNPRNKVGPRPDFGRILHVDYAARKIDANGNSETPVSWLRTNEARDICRKERACNMRAGGRVVATVAGLATSGEGSATCEPEMTIQTARCGPNGQFQSQPMTGTAAQLRSVIGTDPASAQGRVLYYPPASGAVPEWRDGPLSTLRTDCEDGKTENPALFQDGQWQIKMISDSLSDCPPQAVAMVRDRVALAETTRTVRWSQPAHPTDLLPETRALGGWDGSGRNWHLTYQPEATQAVNAPIKIDIDYGFLGRNARMIDIRGRVQVRAAPAFAKMAGFSGHCIYEMEVEAKLLGR